MAETININLSNQTSDIRTQFYPPIQLDYNKRHEIALNRLETYNSIPNINDDNNIIRYEINGGKYEIKIPTGAYELSQINDYIQKNIIEHNCFEIIANDNTLKAIIRINNSTVKVFFDHENSINELLGFNSETLQDIGSNEGSSLVNILSINSIFVNCDIVTGSYVNSSQKPVLYNFFPNVPSGYKVVETPNSPIYLPISQTCIESIRLRLTDQNQNPINLRGETLTISLALRSI